MKKKNFIKHKKYYMMIFVWLTCNTVYARAEFQKNIQSVHSYDSIGHYENIMVGNDSQKQKQDSISDLFYVMQDDITLQFQNIPISVYKVIEASDNSVLILYRTEDDEKWQCRISIFTEYGKEKWQYIIREYDIDSGLDSDVDVCVNDLEIKIDAYDNREQLEYSEVVLNWDGTVQSKKNVRILDDMRQRVHDFSMYTVKEFYTNDQAEILSKKNNRVTVITMPYGFHYFKQVSQELLVCTTINEDNVVFQIIDQQGEQRLINGKGDVNLEFKCFAGIRDQKVYGLFTSGDDSLRWLLCSIDLGNDTLNFKEIPLDHYSAWYSTMAAIIQEGIVFVQHDYEQRQLCFTLLKWDGECIKYLKDIQNGYYEFLDNDGGTFIRGILWDGTNKCANVVKYTMTYNAK